jgi:hypothetical protein
MIGSWSLALAKLQCIGYSSMQGLYFLIQTNPAQGSAGVVSATPWPSLHGKLGHGKLVSRL